MMYQYYCSYYYRCFSSYFYFVRVTKFTNCVMSVLSVTIFEYASQGMVERNDII